MIRPAKYTELFTIHREWNDFGTDQGKLSLAMLISALNSKRIYVAVDDIHSSIDGFIMFSSTDYSEISHIVITHHTGAVSTFKELISFACNLAYQNNRVNLNLRIDYALQHFLTDNQVEHHNYICFSMEPSKIFLEDTPLARKATMSDIPALVRLYREYFTDIDELTDLDWIIERDLNNIHVVDIDNKVVGFSITQPRPGTNNCLDMIEVYITHDYVSYDLYKQLLTVTAKDSVKAESLFFTCTSELLFDACNAVGFMRSYSSIAISLQSAQQPMQRETTPEKVSLTSYF